MRLIDADRLIEELNEVQVEGNELYKGLGEAKVMVCYQPTIDAVEVVRCKDCKHSEHWYRDKYICNLWSGTGIGVFENGYCSYGERRTENETDRTFPTRPEVSE